MIFCAVLQASLIEIACLQPCFELSDYVPGSLSVQAMSEHEL